MKTIIEIVDIPKYNPEMLSVLARGIKIWKKQQRQKQTIPK